MAGKHLSNETVGDLRDHRLAVARLIQEKFFPWPPVSTSRVLG